MGDTKNPLNAYRMRDGASGDMFVSSRHSLVKMVFLEMAAVKYGSLRSCHCLIMYFGIVAAYLCGFYFYMYKIYKKDIKYSW